MFAQILAAATYNARCAHSLLPILSSLGQRNRTKLSPSNPLLLFALAPSLTTPPEVLSNIVSTLTRLYPDHVGCISAPLPYQYLDPSICSEPYSCSLAYALVNGVSFRSTIPGRAEVQVGRWHAARQRKPEDAKRATREHSRVRIVSELSESDGKVDWEDVWARSANSATGPTSVSLGNGMDLETLPDTLRDLNPSVVNSILYFSDKAPEGLATILESTFPRANKLSLIASSTPFITGRPVTLFYNGSILSNGAIGVAFNSSPSLHPPMVELSFPPLLALSSELSVTSCEGNLILSLDYGNPTQLLLGAIRKHGLATSHAAWVGKEDEFYVGVINSSDEQVCQLHRIDAGDPSRGSIALDSPSAPRQGSTIRLYHLPKDTVPAEPRCLPYTDDLTRISLFVAPEATPVIVGLDSKLGDGLTADSNYMVIPDAFLAASENGFTLSRGARGPWKCVVPGGCTGLSWNPH